MFILFKGRWLSSLAGGEWAVAESQRGMMQDKVEFVYQGATPWKTGNFLRERVEPFTGGWVSCCWVPKRDDAAWSDNCIPRCNAVKNEHLSERKSWALYRRVSELLLSPKEGWRRMKWIVCHDAAPWKTGIFLRSRVELFTRGWVSCCWVLKRDGAGWSENCIPRCNALKNGHLPERKGWSLYRNVSELILSPKEDELWSENCMPMCNALKNGNLLERKG